MQRNIYNRKGWVLGACKQCGRLNYVEPHGTTASCSPQWTEHANLPYEQRNMMGTVWLGANRLDPNTLPV